jgi:hypothetical protein
VPPSDRVQQQARLNAPDNLGGEQPLTVLAYLCILEGVAAARAGEPACANPYDPSCENGCRWQAGWLETRNAIRAPFKTCPGGHLAPVFCAPVLTAPKRPLRSGAQKRTPSDSPCQVLKGALRRPPWQAGRPNPQPGYWAVTP